MPIQQRSEDDHHRRAVGLLPAGPLAMVAAAVVEDPVTEEEGQRAAGEADRHGIGAAAFECFLREVEGQRADQHARPESHDETDRSLRSRKPQAEHRAHNEREPADQSPKSRFEHVG
ncbi:MAG TPA: hypothetical protein VF660_09440 [Actinomycetota bacterium]